MDHNIALVWISHEGIQIKLNQIRSRICEYVIAACLGALQRIFFQKIRDYYGSGWGVGPGLTLNFFSGKSSQNNPKATVIFRRSIPSGLEFRQKIYLSDGQVDLQNHLSVMKSTCPTQKNHKIKRLFNVAP